MSLLHYVCGRSALSLGKLAGNRTSSPGARARAITKACSIPFCSFSASQVPSVTLPTFFFFFFFKKKNRLFFSLYSSITSYREYWTGSMFESACCDWYMSLMPVGTYRWPTKVDVDVDIDWQPAASVAYPWYM